MNRVFPEALDNARAARLEYETGAYVPPRGSGRAGPSIKTVPRGRLGTCIASSVWLRFRS